MTVGPLWGTRTKQLSAINEKTMDLNAIDLYLTRSAGFCVLCQWLTEQKGGQTVYITNVLA